MDFKNYKIQIQDKDLTFQINNLVEQANGSVFVRQGDTLVLATAVLSKSEKDVDFFPLTVEYEERYYAAGKILGSRYIRRESRPSDEAILTSRLIDRAIRPLFPKNFRQEVQIIITCLSWDRENDPDILGLLAASQALAISNIPWHGPVAGLRIAKIDDNFILNPTYEEREKSQMEITVSAVKKNGEILVNMIEAEGQEFSENEVLEAINFALPQLKEIIDFEEEIAQKEGKEKLPYEKKVNPLVEKEIKEYLNDKLEDLIFLQEKKERASQLEELKKNLLNLVQEKFPEENNSFLVNQILEEEIERLLQKNVLKLEKRPDGRKLDEVRKISCQVGILPRTHGSGLFCRGQTKTLSILTLGSPGDVKLLEGMEIIGKKRFMHHYNFPPYSTGEIKPLRGPGRREIGHGMLVEKALLPLIPSFEEFPYTLRVVSEVLSSNGSTSMASVSSASLALMDAGVPIKRPAAGISIGLIQDQLGNYKVLTDIQGPEDHYGDMDFKVAGTEIGITAIQMDVKIMGINQTILKEALEKAKKARLEILEVMSKVLDKPRPELSAFAPRILTLQINPEKIREVIGPGGKVINEIIADTGVEIDIQPSGLIYIASEKEEAAKKAIAWIKNITREVKVGEVFQGKVKRILDFGALVEILPKQEGLIHISQLAPYRVRKVEDVIKVGDIVPVKVISIDEQGRVNLSLKEREFQKIKHRKIKKIKKF